MKGQVVILKTNTYEVKRLYITFKIKTVSGSWGILFVFLVQAATVLSVFCLNFEAKLLLNKRRLKLKKKIKQIET